MTTKEPTIEPARKDPGRGAVIADRYEVDSLIARGGMAAVYLAHHTTLNRPIALKILNPPPDAEDASAFEERFRLEAETLAQLDHPHIVILHDFGEMPDGRFYLAMEYVDGPRLSDVLREGPLSAERAIRLLLQVCAALRYAHKRGVVHRDLKPSNLLIRTTDDGEEQVKVVDFGLVKLTEADQSITRAGLILGSPHCMAPEQVKGLPVDHRADVYAVGVLLFRTLTGSYPFHGANSAATMIAHLNQPVPTFFSKAPDIVGPAGLEETVRKCLEKDPADRYQDMTSLMDDLAACIDVSPELYRSVSQSHSTIQSQFASSTSRRNAGLLIAGGMAAITFAFLMLVGTVILWVVMWSDPEPTPVPEEPPPDPVELVGPTPTPALEVGTPEEADEPDAVDEELGDQAVGDEAAPDDPEAAEPSDEEGSADDAAQPEAEPVTPPRPTPRPTPVRQPTPTPAPTPSPPEQPDEGEDTDEEVPEGYMGLPDDLFQ